jgi:hypothetical protein
MLCNLLFFKEVKKNGRREKGGYPNGVIVFRIVRVGWGVRFLCIIFKITNTERICFLKLCFDGLENP